MRVTEKRTKEEDIVTDIRCDICGESTCDEQGCNFHYAKLTAWWVYGSPKDGEYHELHICELCYDKSPFLSKVRVYDYSMGMTPVNKAAEKGGPPSLDGRGS